ncbi:four helix bundle protein [Prevotella sp. PCHR]|uniref:Four helix bundle protein n=2 Tax=Prevotellaceae TaxID=171552 RepID=A0ABX2B6B2_9BACT|nr:four helix bundle protein [Xylanibacter caecicola]
MLMTRTFEDILAWQKAHELVIKIYKITRTFPETEKFGLCQQFQRAAVSIAANIAEGYKKLGKADKLRFFNISQGSLKECRYYCILSKGLTYIDENTFHNLVSEIQNTSFMLNAYIKGVVCNSYIKD